MQLVEWKPVKSPQASIAGSSAQRKECSEKSTRDYNRLKSHIDEWDWRTMQAAADEVRSKMQIKPTDLVLEVGCGMGAFLSVLLYPGQKGFGFDLCEAQVRRGGHDPSLHGQIKFGAADAQRLPLRTESFDKVVCYGLFQRLPDQKTATRVLQELVRVCKDEGSVLIGDVSGMLEEPRRFLTRLGLRERLTENLLTIAAPFWSLRRHWHKTSQRLCLRRSFFRNAVKGLPCEVHFNTFGAGTDTRSRFDVCITKFAASHGPVRAPIGPSRQPEPICHRITLEEFQSFEEMLPYKEDWNALAEKVGADIFASFDWCATWWKHFHHRRKPKFFIARAEGRMVACLPLFHETVGYGPWRIDVIRLAGSCDAGTRCDLAIEPGYIPAVFREVLRRLDQTGPWDIIHIGDLPGDYDHGRVVAQALHEAAKQARVIYRTGYYSNSVFDIPETYQQYLNQLSQNERSSIRRTERRLAQEHHAIVENVSPEELDAAFQEFHQQHEAWWARSGHLGYFRDWPGSLEFHRDFSKVQAREGRLHLLRLSAGNETVGFHYCHRFGKRIHWFSGSRSSNSRWDAYSPGRQLHCAIVRQAVELGLTQIDGMNGYFEYKKRWGARYNQLQNITLLSKDAWSRLAIRDFRSASRLHYLYNRVWYWHLAPWLRRRFPQFTPHWLERGQTQKFMRTRFMEYASADQADDAICYPAA